MKKNKTLVLMLLAVMVVSCLLPSAAFAKTYIDEWGTVDSVVPKKMKYSFLRSGMDATVDNVVGHAYNGDWVYVYYEEVTRAGKKWAYVYHEDSGKEGYMWAGNIVYDNSGSTSGTGSSDIDANLTGEEEWGYYCTVDSVYPKTMTYSFIRSKPADSENNVVTNVKNGQDVYVYWTGYSAGGKKFWAYVSYNGYKGYMWADNLGGFATGDDDTVSVDLTGISYVYADAEIDSVYPKTMKYSFIRSTPSDLEDNVLATARNGDAVYVICTGYSAGGKKYWAYVEHEKSGQTGYMWADNLDY